MDILQKDIENVFVGVTKKYAIRQYLTLEDSYICVKHLIGNLTKKGYTYEKWNTYKVYDSGPISYVITLETSNNVTETNLKEIKEWITHFKQNRYDNITIDYMNFI